MNKFFDLLCATERIDIYLTKIKKPKPKLKKQQKIIFFPNEMISSGKYIPDVWWMTTPSIFYWMLFTKSFKETTGFHSYIFDSLICMDRLFTRDILSLNLHHVKLIIFCT